MIPETLEELIDPRYTAVAVVDAQNDFCKEGGYAHEYGGDLTGYREAIENIRRLVEEARRVGALVVYTMNTALHNHASDSAALLYYWIKDWAQGDPDRIPNVTVEGTWGEEIVDELKPREGDVVVKKNRSSGFIQTNLDLVLRNHGVKTLVTVGFVSNGCVFATARDGDMFDYFIVVAKDAVNSPRKDLHAPAMKLMEWRFDVYSTDQLIEAWKKKKRR